jgi:hypothetical protein
VKIIWKILKQGTGKHSRVEETLSVKVTLYTVLNLEPTLLLFNCQKRALEWQLNNAKEDAITYMTVSNL